MEESLAEGSQTRSCIHYIGGVVILVERGLSRSAGTLQVEILISMSHFRERVAVPKTVGGPLDADVQSFP